MECFNARQNYIYSASTKRIDIAHRFYESGLGLMFEAARFRSIDSSIQHDRHGDEQYIQSVDDGCKSGKSDALNFLQGGLGGYR